ncbi:hypothetical protein Tco_0645378, partial [Tanacetum coccineum]
MVCLRLLFPLCIIKLGDGDAEFNRDLNLEALLICVQKEMAPSGSNALLFDVHYDGIFMFAPLRYENGVVYELRVTKDKKYDYDGLCEFLKEKLEQRFYAMFFKLPECELDVGLKIVECDSDLEAMIHENRKKDAGNMSYEELVSWAEAEAQHLNTPPKPKIFDYGDTGASFESVDDQTGAPSAADHTGPSEAVDEMSRDKIIEDDNIVNKVVDKGKGKMIEEERSVPARKAIGRNKGIVIEENDNPNVMDSDSSDGEVEVDEIPDYSMKRNSEAKRAPKVSKQKPCSDKEGGEGISRPKTLYGLGETETVLEHEEFMDDLVRKMRECDDDAELTDPFKLVETIVEKYRTHDQDTHWKMKKPKVGEKFTDADQFKECLTYYGLANGYSIWCYRSLKTQIIARCGQRPERIKDPKKGKLSKHFGNKIRINPNIKLHEITDMVMKKYKCIVSPSQCRRAKRWALNEGENKMVDHYGYIRSYAKAILESNDGSTVRVGEMAPSRSNALLFDVHYVGIFMFAPLRYENGVVYELRVIKDKKYDYEGLCQLLKEKFKQRFYAMSFKLPECELDVAHIPQNLAEYYFKNFWFDESGDEAICKLKIHENRKNDAGNMSYEELVSWDEVEAQHLNTPPKPKTVSKKVWDSLTPKKNDTGACGSGTNVEFELDYVDTGASLESVDDQTGAPSAADHTSPSEAVDEMSRDKIIEEDNIFNKVVDKGKGKMIKEERPVPARKAMGRNKGIVIEENDNLNVMDAAHFKSSKTQIIARCGQRPERIKDPKKGKLSKWKRYPSENSTEGAECPW